MVTLWCVTEVWNSTTGSSSMKGRLTWELSCLPWLPQFISAEYCEHIICWCYLYLWLFVLLLGTLTQGDTLLCPEVYQQLQLAAFLRLPQSVSTKCKPQVRLLHFHHDLISLKAPSALLKILLALHGIPSQCLLDVLSTRINIFLAICLSIYPSIIHLPLYYVAFLHSVCLLQFLSLPSFLGFPQQWTAPCKTNKPLSSTNMVSGSILS